MVHLLTTKCRNLIVRHCVSYLATPEMNIQIRCFGVH